VGHRSSRLSLEGGTESSLHGFSTFGVRFALHDLLDPSPGYPENSQIEFFNIKARYFFDASKFELDELTLFRITSLSPWSEFSKKTSFRAQFGLERFMDRNCSRCVGASFQGGPGITIQPFGSSLVNVFAIADFQVAYSPGFTRSDVRLGGGPTGGLLFNVTPYFKALISGSYKYLLFSADPKTYQGTFETRYTLNSRIALNLRFTQWMDSREGAAGMLWYF
jgi:hypothetical protein